MIFGTQKGPQWWYIGSTRQLIAVAYEAVLIGNVA